MLSRVRVLLAVAGMVGVAVCPAAAQGVLDLDGRAVDLFTIRDVRAHVLVFTTTDCPISDRYAPEVARLARDYAARGVRFWLVYPVPGDTPGKIRAHSARFGFGMPAVRDTLFTLVRRTGVTVTPEAAVIEPSGGVAYRGRVDDRYVDLGLDRPVPTTRDLDHALASLLAGRPIEPSTTRAVGCILSDLLP